MTTPQAQETATSPPPPIAGERVLEVDGASSPTPAPSTAVTKVIVAVHGVGDQHSYATIQSVVNQFLRFYKEPAGHPLGPFHNEKAAYELAAPYSVDKDKLGRFAFAEVYWAGVPRDAVANKYMLEETKKWGRTIVERLRLRWREAKHQRGYDGGCVEADFDRLDQVLGEMMSTVAVLERLCFLADKAGLFTFDLRKLVDDYLGDVQIVAEFERLRKEILKQFSETMGKVHEAYPNADIYLVAHSEGTVVSFLGLLAAARLDPQPAWLARVRGLMTFGSPIDKHLILWPELFGKGGPSHALERRIEWWNYYDRGDPIGFELNDARQWLARGGWNQVFHFDGTHDVGFTRYAFPGKAHVDYWNDEDVFRHFIDTVVNQPAENAAPPSSPGTAAVAATAPCAPPGDRRWQKWSSYVLPYVGVLGLLAIAVYVLFKAVSGYLDPDGAAKLSTGIIARNVSAIATLLLGVTVVARIPRLTRLPSWRWAALGIYVLCAAAFLAFVPARLPGVPAAAKAGVEGASAADAAAVSRSEASAEAWSARVERAFGIEEAPAGLTRATVATALVILLFWVSGRRPDWGLKPLLVLGAAAVALVVAIHLRGAPSSEVGPIWAVLVAGVAFLYLWWLAALIFDLVFVWHVYVRQAVALQRMDRIIGSTARGTPPQSTPAVTAPAPA